MSKFKPGQSGNPRGRRPGSRNKRTDILDAITTEFGGESEFWQHVAKAAKSGDNECLRILAARIRPTLKPVAPLIKATLKLESLESSLESIIREVANGNIPSDQAKDLIAAAKDVASVSKLLDFEERLHQLEVQRARIKAV